MSIDALSLAAIRDELEAQVRGCRIQKIIPTGELSVVLEAYNPGLRQRKQFVLSADAQNARVHLMTQKASQMPGEVSPFLLLLRKYVRYGIITTIEQSQSERILTFTIEKKFPTGKRPRFDAANTPPTAKDLDDDDDELTDDNAADLEIYQSRLVCEIMGRHSNIALLSEDNVIIDVIKRVAPSKNRYRLILPHQLYVTPPSQDKQVFHRDTSDSFVMRMDLLKKNQPKQTLAQALVSTFSGVSPQIAREVAYRIAERKEQTIEETTLDTFQRWDSVYGDLSKILAPLNPYKLPRNEGDHVVSIVKNGERIVAFAPYELRQFREKELEPEFVESISQAAELFFSQVDEVSGQAQRKHEIAGRINEHYERLRRKANAMEGSIKKAESAEELKRKGEAIYAHLWEITPEMTDFSAEGLKIKLNPDLKPSENAQAYFREYDKAKQAMAGVPELLAEVKQSIEYLDEMLTQLELAETFEEVNNLKGELQESGYGTKEPNNKPAPKKSKRRLPQTPAYTSSEGFTIYVGKSSQHNDYVTFELGDRNDLWLHARGVPGSHVIIKTMGKEVPDQTLLEAAQIALYYSKNRLNSKGEVTYAPQRYIRKVKGPYPGLVTYSNDKSLNVTPKKPVKPK
jgi:predicted ribosome quality control (RQC) complex YloA/Tae2 family protein